MRCLLSRLAMLVAAVLGACRGSTPRRPGAPPPALGAHTLLTHDQGKGTSPATTAPVDTQPAGSLFLALSMGRTPNFVTPTDSHGNTWKLVGSRNAYSSGGPFYTAVWAATSARGGSGHTVSAVKKSDPLDEITLAFVEIKNGTAIEDHTYVYPKKGEPVRARPVKTAGPATLVAIWGGDAWEINHTAVPGDGFEVIEKYLDLGPTMGVQVAIATKQVTEPGTYGVTWEATPPQGAALYLIAVQ